MSEERIIDPPIHFISELERINRLSEERLRNQKRIANLEAALKDIIADCESNWISAQMIAGIARKALEGK
jgi:hypothetical protein